jgi:hypothetical protein
VIYITEQGTPFPLSAVSLLPCSADRHFFLVISGMVGGGSGSAGGPTGGYAGGGGSCYGVAVGGTGVGSGGGGGSTPRLGTGSGRFVMVPPPRMIDPEEMIQRAAAEEWLCTGCMRPLTELRICYPNAGADTSQEFLDLNFVATYLVGDS